VLVAAGVSLVLASAATLAIPSGFKLVIDKGFTSANGAHDIGRWFEYLMLIVTLLAVASASRFYFFSLLGERVVADLRVAVQRHLLRQSPSFFEENRPSEIAARMTADAAVIELIVGSTISIALRKHADRHWRHRLSVHHCPEADRLSAGGASRWYWCRSSGSAPPASPFAR
jgi:ATP-binding cassette subfamily B protein